jgi:hypothetical protein
MSEPITVIIPAAGDGHTATVVDGVRKPTWLQVRPDGVLVLSGMLQQLDLADVSQVVVAVRKAHIDAFCAGDADAVARHVISELADAGHALKADRLKLYVMAHNTSSAAETVRDTIVAHAITGAIFIKDCDGAFPLRVVAGNHVVVMTVTPDNANQVHCLPAKSFVRHSGGILTSIQEKVIVSSHICVGGYGFAEADQFTNAYTQLCGVQKHATEVLLSETTHRLFNSHIVYHLMLRGGVVFTTTFVDHFEDWKTADGWRSFVRAHRNVVMPLEGVLIAHRDDVSPFSEAPLAERFVPLPTNIAALVQDAKKHAGRTRVVITSVQPKSRRAEVEALVAQYGIPCDDLLLGMQRCATHLFGVNDEATPHPAVTASPMAPSADQLAVVLNSN